MESTPLLSSQQNNNNNGSNRHGRTPSSSSYYFLNKQGGTDVDNGGNVVEEMPVGAAEEEFAPRPLGPRVRVCACARVQMAVASVVSISNNVSLPPRGFAY
jgi:hypothetical protein